jgi:hypothetical protein
VLTTMGSPSRRARHRPAIGAKDNLRVVVKAVRRAQMIAAGDRENLTPDHLRLAYRQLGGALAR